MSDRTLVEHVLGFWGFEKRSRITGAAASVDDTFLHSDKADVSIGLKEWDRTLGTANVQKLNKESWAAYRTNPIFQSLVEMVVSMIVGNKVTIVVNGLEELKGAELANAQKLQDVLDAHWFDPRNDWQKLLPDISRDAFIFGEVIPIPNTDYMTGDTFWGFIPPEAIKKMNRDPLNARRVISLVVQASAGEELELPIIQKDSSGNSRDTLEKFYGNAQNSTANRLTGRCYYWALNRALTSARGAGDFVQAIRPAKDAVRLISSVSDRAYLNNRVVGDIQFPDNWSQEQINAALDPTNKDEYINPPRVDMDGPQVFGHSAGIQWKFVTPQIAATESEAVFKMLKAIVCVSAHNVPEHILFGQGENANRATAYEMGDPFYQYLNARQTIVKNWIGEICDFVIDQKLIFSNELDGIPEDKLYDYTIVMPSVDVDNVSQQVDIVNKKLLAVTSAKMTGGVDEQQAGAIARDLLEELGMKIPESQGITE